MSPWFVTIGAMTRIDQLVERMGGLKIKRSWIQTVPEPVYPSYVVGEPDDGVDNVQVAMVGQPKSSPDQVEDLLERLLKSMAPPVPEAKRRPRVGALMGWSAHVWIRIYDCWLEWRSWPVGLFVSTVINRQLVRRPCLLPTLPGSGFWLYLLECRSQRVMLALVGPCGMTSPSDLTSSGPVGPIANPVCPGYTWPGGLVQDAIPV